MVSFIQTAFAIFFRSSTILDQRDRRINCQLSPLLVNSLVSSDLVLKRNWRIYEKLGGNVCNTAMLLNGDVGRPGGNFAIIDIL